MLNHSSLFYWGTLLSSVGSLVFTGALIPFLAYAGTDLATIGLVLGGTRIIAVACVSFFGPLLEAYSPRKLTVILECIAGLVAVAIWWVVVQDVFSLPAFWTLYLIRSLVVNAQTGLKAKMAKILSGESQSMASRHATMLNNVTQGATLFAGICTWYMVDKINFGWIVLFDALTFLIASTLLLLVPIATSANMRTSYAGFKSLVGSGALNLYKHGRKWAYLDVFLAFVMSGSTMLWTRLAEPNLNMVPAFFVTYGLAVWCAGPLSRSSFSDRFENQQWLWLGLANLLLAQFAGQGLIILAFSFVRDLFFWMILHRISARLMHHIPLEVSNASHSFRNFQMIGILSLGEWIVGAASSKTSILMECSWRAIACFLVFGILLKKFPEKRHV